MRGASALQQLVDTNEYVTLCTTSVQLVAEGYPTRYTCSAAHPLFYTQRALGALALSGVTTDRPVDMCELFKTISSNQSLLLWYSLVSLVLTRSVHIRVVHSVFRKSLDANCIHVRGADEREFRTFQSINIPEFQVGL